MLRAGVQGNHYLGKLILHSAHHWSCSDHKSSGATTLQDQRIRVMFDFRVSEGVRVFRGVIK